MNLYTDCDILSFEGSKSSLIRCLLPDPHYCSWIERRQSLTPSEKELAAEIDLFNYGKKDEILESKRTGFAPFCLKKSLNPFNPHERFYKTQTTKT